MGAEGKGSSPPDGSPGIAGPPSASEEGGEEEGGEGKKGFSCEGAPAPWGRGRVLSQTVRPRTRTRRMRRTMT